MIPVSMQFYGLFLFLFSPPNAPSFLCFPPHDLTIHNPRTSRHTGGKGSITQWVHGEFIVISEAIHSHFTHQAHGEHF